MVFDDLVVMAGESARAAVASLAAAEDAAIDEALCVMASTLERDTEAVLAANIEDVRAARASALPGPMVDRLRLDDARLAGMADQLRSLAAVSHPPTKIMLQKLDGGLRVEQWHRPVGVIGANFEARPNVTIDVASQLLKSRNVGVLRTGGAALRSAAALVDQVIAPALASCGLDPAAVQLLRVSDRDAAFALVRQPHLIPLVVLRGSGTSTRMLAQEAGKNGVRTLAHADGGGVMYVDQAADPARLRDLVERGLDRLGVCNRLNLLLVSSQLWDSVVPELSAQLASLGVKVSMPPHAHPLGHEWSLDEGNEATVTIAPVDSIEEAARVASEETSGIAATIVTEDKESAQQFLSLYRGTGAFWNATTRLLDGYRLFGIPETGINVDHVPGPRGPVTFRDLSLRQFVVLPD